MAHPGYEPTWERIVQAWSDWAGPMEDEGDLEEWLAQVRREAAAEALREAARECEGIRVSTGSRYIADFVLEHRAARIENESLDS